MSPTDRRFGARVVGLLRRVRGAARPAPGRHRHGLGAGLVAVLLSLSALVAAWWGVPAITVAVVVAAALGAFGVALIRWDEGTVEPDQKQERHVKGPDLLRRRLIGAGGAAIGVAAAGGTLVAAGGRNREATVELRRTAWRSGVGLVTADGSPVRADELDIGEMLTVFPADAIGAADAQALLLRLAPGVVRSGGVPNRNAAEVPDGVVAFSRLCTHMGCPLGLYQQRDGVLLCPCHQALFDATDAGKVLRGPAGRPLPGLPLTLDREGRLLAAGPLTDAVATGFWGRP